MKKSMLRISIHELFYFRRFFRVFLLLMIVEYFNLLKDIEHKQLIYTYLAILILLNIPRFLKMKSYVYENSKSLTVKHFSFSQEILFEDINYVALSGSSWFRLSPMYIELTYIKDGKENDLNFVTSNRNKYKILENLRNKISTSDNQQIIKLRDNKL